MNKKYIQCISLVFVIMICNHLSAQDNTLSAAEKKEGWQSLFNGKDLKGWHSYGETKPGNSWQIEDGTIALVKDSKSVEADFADLTSDKEYENFDLKFEWKLDTCGNSGVMFYVHESPEYKQTWETGPEMQLEDLICSPDHLSRMNRSGSIYDLAGIDSEFVKEGNTWYEFEIRINKGHAELFQNGHKVIDTHLWDDQWKAAIAATKFKDMPNFGTFHKGHIAFQGTETGKLWLRNIRIKNL